MPTYEYRCPKGHDFEKFYRSIGAAPAEERCPECGALGERRMSLGGGLVFKGSGFYITDYGKDGKKAQNEAEKKAATKAADASSTSGESAAKTGDASAKSGESAAPAPASRDSGSTSGGDTASSPREKKKAESPPPPKPAATKPKSGE